MAWPENLTSNQIAAIESLATSCRSWGAGLAQLNILGVAIGADYYSGLNSLLSGLTQTDVVPNTSGYDGAQDLLVSELVTLVGWAFTLSNPANGTQGTGAFASVGIQQLCMKAAGINASITK